MRFLFLTMEATNNSALKSAAGELNREFGCGLDVSIFNLGLHNGNDTWRELEESLVKADFVFGSMLFSEEIVRPLERLLSSVTCPVCIITSNPALIRQTRIGRFVMQKPAEEEKKKSVFSEWVEKLKPAKSHGESRRQLTLVRNIGKIMKHIPGKARDIHTFMAAHQFWLNGSDENMLRFLSMLIDRYIPSFEGKHLPVKDPIFYPDTALFHPDAPEPFYSAATFMEWRRKTQPARQNGTVVILSMRATVLSKNMRHIEQLQRALESRDIDTCIAYSGGLDFRPALERFFASGNPARLDPELLINATGFSLVGGPAENNAGEAVTALKQTGVPYVTLVPLSFQSIRQWKSDNQGLAPLQTALSVAIPELDGAIEPHVYAGMEEKSDRTVPLAPEVESVADRVRKRVQLRRKKAGDKRIAIVLFNFPPNLGNAGTAAYLDVFESIFRLLGELQKAGYSLRMPESADALREELLGGNSLAFGTDGNVAEHFPVDLYRKLCHWHPEIEPFWGDAPGELLSDGRGFHILGERFGNIFIGQQPSFGYERDPMRLLTATDATPNHAFAAFYTWLEHVYRADAVIHFGTHGAMEFMPGKQVGLSASCWPKRLIGSLPNFYYYCVNNPSEGAIAKRRGFATLISYLSPPLEQAGLYKGLRRMRELIAAYLQKPSPDLLGPIGELADELDLGVEREGVETDAWIAALNGELYQVEERMIPLGLHTLGTVPEPENLVDHLTFLASHSRPELDGLSFPEYICRRKHLDYRSLLDGRQADRESEAAWRTVQTITKESLRLFTGKPLPPDAGKSVRARMLDSSFPVRVSEAEQYLRREGVLKPGQLDGFWSFLQRVLAGMTADRELDAMLDALSGRYVEPSPGNDLVRNPDIVPTGRNIHSLDPFSIPSSFAVERGRKSADALLERYRQECGCLPYSVAMVLWGTDNLKSDGEGVAQALALLGARVKTDELGKISDVELIPPGELARPRIDVVMTVSGIFRDLLSHQIKLLDKAVRLAAEADEPEETNYVRKHVLLQMEEEGVSLQEASGRIFANAPGSYGANVNHLVESGTWEKDDELARTFVNRKSFAYNTDGAWQESPEILTSALRNVSLTYQNIDSLEIGISDIDHYYEYLGGVSKAVEHASSSKPKVMVGDINGLGDKKKIFSLEQIVALESRTKLLNPKWYESMLNHGYEGVREIESHLSNTYGWSATASAVGDWTYQQFNETYLQDRDMLEKLKTLNLHATMSMTRRLLEAHSRGFWETDNDTIEELQELYADLESRMEGAHSET